MKNYELMKVDQIIDPKGTAMGPFGSNITSDNFIEKGVPVIRGNNLKNNVFLDDDFVYISEEKADELKSSNVYPNDIIFTHRGTLGQVAIIPKSSKFKRYVISQSQMKLTVKKTINPNYIYYFFISEWGQYEILKNKNSTGVPAIAQPLTSLNEIKIPIVTNIEIQNIISDIFSPITEKISLIEKEIFLINQIISESLKLDIIKNKKHYKEKSISNACDIIMGQSPPGESYNESGDGIPFFQGSKDFGNVFPTKRTYCTKPKKLAEPFDILFSVRAPIASINIANEKCCIGRGLASLRLKENHSSILYFLLKHSQNRFKQYFGSDGTIFGSMSKDDWNDFKILVPDNIILKKYVEDFKLFESKILVNEKMLENLKSIMGTTISRIFIMKTIMN